MNVRGTGFAALRAVPNYPKRIGAAPAGVAIVGCSLDLMGAGIVGDPMMDVGGIGFVGVTTWWWMRNVVRPQSTRGRLVRESERSQRAGGVASWIDVQEHASRKALRKRASALRPSLAGRYRIKATDVGVLLATTGIGKLPGQQVWSTCEDVTVRLGGPRRGKTLSLACHGLDAPGALVTTSTRADLAEQVHRAREDRPVHVMNITGYGGIVSNVRWSILEGCRDYGTAIRRATDLITEDHGAKDASFWAGKAREVLALLLHAAALDGRRARDILKWATAEDAATIGRIIDILSSPDAGPGGPERAWQLRQHYAEAQNTRKSVIATLAPHLAWLADDVARDLGDATAWDVTFDAETLIRDRQTLHLISGSRSVAGVSSLIACIVAEVVYTARQMSGDQPGGRLDPPLTILLDEAALVAPVPLPQWTADMGGRGITLHVSIQSLAQMRERWGENGASTILGNVGALMVFGGSKDPGDLEKLSKLTGETKQRVLGSDWKNEGDVEHRWVPVATAAQISNLREGEVLLFRRGLDAVIGWAPLVVKRRGWKAGRLPREIESGVALLPKQSPALDEEGVA